MKINVFNKVDKNKFEIYSDVLLNQRYIHNTKRYLFFNSLLIIMWGLAFLYCCGINTATLIIVIVGTIAMYHVTETASEYKAINQLYELLHNKYGLNEDEIVEYSCFIRMSHFFYIFSEKRFDWNTLIRLGNKYNDVITFKSSENTQINIYVYIDHIEVFAPSNLIPK